MSRFRAYIYDIEKNLILEVYVQTLTLETRAAYSLAHIGVEMTGVSVHKEGWCSMTKEPTTLEGEKIARRLSLDSSSV